MKLWNPSIGEGTLHSGKILYKRMPLEIYSGMVTEIYFTEVKQGNCTPRWVDPNVTSYTMGTSFPEWGLALWTSCWEPLSGGPTLTGQWWQRPCLHVLVKQHWEWGEWWCSPECLLLFSPWKLLRNDSENHGNQWTWRQLRWGVNSEQWASNASPRNSSDVLPSHTAEQSREGWRVQITAGAVPAGAHCVVPKTDTPKYWPLFWTSWHLGQRKHSWGVSCQDKHGEQGSLARYWFPTVNNCTDLAAALSEFQEQNQLWMRAFLWVISLLEKPKWGKTEGLDPVQPRSQ